MDLRVKIGNKYLSNPVGTASGTFGYGDEYADLVDLSCLGAIYSKAVTPLPRTGNPMPRLIETASGLINSIGLANVGVEKFKSDKMPFLKRLPCAVILNVAGSTEDDYINVIESLDDEEGIWGYEVNISCPNVKKGGLAFGTDPVMVEQLTSRLRKLTKKPLIMKLTPNVTDIAIIAFSAENGGADAISCINTLKGMVIDIHRKQPVFDAKTGGLSGPAIKPVGLAAVYSVTRKVSIPVIGLGGIMNASDAIEYLLAGAHAVQIGTGTFTDPTIPETVLEGITQYMVQEKLSSIDDFHGFF